MTREEQNDFIRAKFKAWQIEWHRIFDADETLAKTEFAPDGRPMPKDIDSDFRLICGISQVPEETRKACFSILPKGEEMWQRFEQFLSGKSEPIPQDKARDIVQQIAENVAIINAEDLSFSVNWSNIIVINQAVPNEIEWAQNAGRISDIYKRNYLKPVAAEALLPKAADLFLTEPLYMSAGNWYEPGYWITGLLGPPERDKIYELTYSLWEGGWFLGVADEGATLTLYNL